VFIVTGFEKGNKNENYISVPYLFIYKLEKANGEQPKEIKRVIMNNNTCECRFYHPEIISKNGKDVYYCIVNNKTNENQIEVSFMKYDLEKLTESYVWKQKHT